MKGYESLLLQTVPASSAYVVRIDGRAFHTFTRAFDRADPRIDRAMTAATAALVSELPSLGYTQSDEISIFVPPAKENGQHWYGGKVPKLCSIMASVATAAFNDSIRQESGAPNRLAHFDARVLPLPVVEMANYLLWRQRDCERNSIQILGQSVYSHKQMHGKKAHEVKERLKIDHDIIWSDLPPRQKWGTFVQRESYLNEEGAKRSRTVVSTESVKHTYASASGLMAGLTEVF